MDSGVSPSFSFLELPLSPPASLLKMLILPFSAWISKKCSKKDLRLGGNRNGDDLNQGGAFYLAVPQLMLTAQKAVKVQQGEGEEAALFFPFKIKTPLKEKMLSCNFGTDFQLLFSLSEWQIHFLFWKKRREEQWPGNLECARYQRKTRRKMGRGRITREDKKQIKSDSEDEGAKRSKRKKEIWKEVPAMAGNEQEGKI